MVREAAPHTLDTQAAGTDDEGRCLVLCAVKLARKPGASANEQRSEPYTGAERWVDPASASLYDPTCVVRLLGRKLGEHDRNGDWDEAQKICDTLTRVLKTPAYRQTEDLKDTIRRMDWGRIPRALPETYRRTKSAADTRSGMAALAIANAKAAG